MKPPGLFLVIEGPDGTGKTTLAQALADALQAGGRQVVRLREPTDGEWGRRIRQAARNHTRPDDPLEEVRWFTEDRREDVATNIRPALANGSVVVLDRYFYSTAAYQGARGVDVDLILAQNREFAPEPDLCLFLRCDVDVARSRIGLRGAHDAFEALDYQRRVAAVFEQLLARPDIGPHVVIDTRCSPDDVLAEAMRAVAPLLTSTPDIR